MSVTVDFNGGASLDDLTVAYRAAEKIRDYWRRRGRKIKVHVDGSGQIISDMSARNLKLRHEEEIRKARITSALSRPKKEASAKITSSDQLADIVEEIVCKKFRNHGVTPEMLRSPRRKESIAMARHFTSFILHHYPDKNLKMSFLQLGRRYNRDRKASYYSAYL